MPERNPSSRILSPIAARYLDLLEQALTGAVLDDRGYTPGHRPVVNQAYDAEARRIGMDWPLRACTMIGLVRLHQLRDAIATVVADGVPGDLIETGVFWRKRRS